jgi:ACS family hexuronate transporter-like MFS transporter
MRGGVPARWIAFGVFTLATALNYLDRQLLAALAPAIRADFALSNAQYGLLLSAFSLAYALSSPLAGLFIDRVGLNRGISFSVAAWSLAGIGTGLVTNFAGLLGVRAALGLAESGGIPASGKANALYLPPKERALGAALNQIGLSLGAAGAPLAAAWLSARHGWRTAFVLTGLLGFLWIPLWLATARAIPPAADLSQERAAPLGQLARDRRLWGLVAANVFSMVLFSLWTNWTTLFLVGEYGLDQTEANRRFAWIPPVFANLGGLFGGWAAYRLIRGGQVPESARVRICRWAGWALVATAAVPFLPAPALATAGISFSFFWTTAMSVNIYAMPLDLFGAGRAASAIAALTFAFGLMQTFVSPGIGALIDRYGFGPVCALGSVLPLAAVAVLGATHPSEDRTGQASVAWRIRSAQAADLEAIAAIQCASPAAARWEPRLYLDYDCRVAVAGRRVAGFIVVRQTGPGEYEILNLAVAPEFRRQGAGAALLRDVVTGRPGAYFLEVRESNLAAQALYRKLGFTEAGLRKNYYTDPPEAAIVMRLQSC